MKAAAVGLALAALAAVPACASERLTSQLARKDADETFTREIAYTNSVCGGALVGHIGWDSFSALAEPPAPGGVVLLCDQALGALEQLCGTGDVAKTRIAESVAVVDCRGGTMRAVALDRGYLSFTTTTEDEDGFTFVRDFLAAWLGMPAAP